MILAKGDAGKSLAEELDYKLIASKIRRHAGGTKPGMITFSRSEQVMKYLYELATSDDTRKQLSDQAEDQRFFRVLDDALNENPLPPWPVLAQYLAPPAACSPATPPASTTPASP